MKIVILCLAMLISNSATAEINSSKTFENLDLYPTRKPFNTGYLQVSDLHSLYYSEFGNPEGIPVVTLHGGPGSGCSDNWSAFFDLEHYHVIMFDQRGSGRSIPYGEMTDNTPQRGVEDIEAIRKHLGIDQWIVFGGSYGSFLALLYGETHPSCCLGFVLRGVSIASREHCDYLFNKMRMYQPEAWDEMAQFIPEEERDNLFAAFHKRVMDPRKEVHLPAAEAFMLYDTIAASLMPDRDAIRENIKTCPSTFLIGRAWIHFAANDFFIPENYILDNISVVADIPTIIVQGRYDIICPPQTAYEVYKNMHHAKLWFIPDAGHSSAEPGIAKGLREAMDEMKSLKKIL